MRIGICDGDEQELEHLLALLREYQLSRGTSFDCRSFHNSTDFLCDMKGGEYDLVLLDAHMPGISGIQAAQELREADKNVRIIFIASSPEFAMESYSVGAYYYLLKPADAGMLFPLLDKAAGEVFVQEEQGIVLKNRGGVVRIGFAEVEYVEVINKTVSFHLADGAIREVTAALADFEERFLSRPEFFKTHRSYLVNLNYIQSININGIMTKNGHSIPVSRQRRIQVQDAYMRFMHQAETVIMTQDVPPAVSSERPKCPRGPWRILLVDDEPAERTFWADILRCHGCMVQLAGNGRDALKLAESEPYDCVLLDVMIPGEDGFAICEKIRKVVQAPVVFLSCLTESDKQLKGFAAGGIDYITKDTPAALFWAKVETRIKLAMSDRTQIRYGPLLMDLTGHKLTMNGKELPLTAAEFDILWQMSEHADHVFTLEEIFAMAWGSQLWDGGQMVQMQMSRLRRKLEKAWAGHHFIETVWGQGYRFVPINN